MSRSAISCSPSPAFRPATAISWFADASVDLPALLDRAPHPTASTIREAIEAALSEQQRFLAELELALAEDTPIRRTAIAHVSATRSSCAGEHHAGTWSFLDACVRQRRTGAGGFVCSAA